MENSASIAKDGEGTPGNHSKPEITISRFTRKKGTTKETSMVEEMVRSDNHY